jgi:TIR domain
VRPGLDRRRIFLAHAREDKVRVRELYADLKNRGLDPWLDEEDLIPGENWRVAIPNAIRAADVFVACLSDHSVIKQGYVQKEFRTALDAFGERPPGTIYLIPVKLSDCDVPDLQITNQGLSLRDLHWVELDAEGGLERLIRAIELAFKATTSAGHEDHQDGQETSLTTPTAYAESRNRVVDELTLAQSPKQERETVPPADEISDGETREIGSASGVVRKNHAHQWKAKDAGAPRWRVRAFALLLFMGSLLLLGAVTTVALLQLPQVTDDGQIMAARAGAMDAILAHVTSTDARWTKASSECCSTPRPGPRVSRTIS